MDDCNKQTTSTNSSRSLVKNMPPSRQPTVNYQEHFGIDNSSRRRGNTNTFDRDNVTPVPADFSLAGDDQYDSDLTGTRGPSEGEDESEGEELIRDFENVDEDIGLEEITPGLFMFPINIALTSICSPLKSKNQLLNHGKSNHNNILSLYFRHV